MIFRLKTSRTEAFSDGVIAIIITIMILELKIPALPEGFTGAEVWKALGHLVPELLAYLLSFIVLGILWLNHHVLFGMLPHISSTLVWYNAFLLFCMSLIPLPTAFLSRYPLLPQASMLYGAVMFLNAEAFLLMRRYVELKARLIPLNPGLQRSNLLSTALYLVSVPLAMISVYISFLIFIGIPLWYFLPDKLHQHK